MVKGYELSRARASSCLNSEGLGSTRYSDFAPSLARIGPSARIMLPLLKSGDRFVCHRIWPDHAAPAFAHAGPHPAIIVSHPDRVARAPLVNVLIGSSQKASRPARENELVLNGASDVAAALCHPNPKRLALTASPLSYPLLCWPAGTPPISVSTRRLGRVCPRRRRVAPAVRGIP